MSLDRTSWLTPSTLHLATVAFIHRFGSCLGTHVHFHVYVVDGVSDMLPCDSTFRAATGLNEAVISQVQANVRKRILRAFVARGHTTTRPTALLQRRAST